MTHPLGDLPRTHRKAALIAVSVAAVLPMLATLVLRPLGTQEDIVAFELAFTVERAEEILAAWQAEDVVGVAKAVQLADFVYPFVYATALAGACLGAADAWQRAGSGRAGRAGLALAWVATSAVVLDYVENTGLDVSLWGRPVAPWPQLSGVAACLKFAAILVPLAYVASWPFAARRRGHHVDHASPAGERIG